MALDFGMEVDEARAAIESFLRCSGEPALLEPGEERFLLRPGAYEMDVRNGRLTLQVWDEKRNLARRVMGLGEQKPGKLELRVRRFGKQEGSAFLVDLRRVPGEERRGARLVFREQFRRSLARCFPGWHVVELSTEADLQESLSPAYARAFLKKGAEGWAAIGAPADPGAAGGTLTVGLIWLDYLRHRNTRVTLHGLALFLPEPGARAVVLRLPFLNADAARFAAFVYSDAGFEERVDPRDCGNLDTRLEDCGTARPTAGPAAGWLERLCAVPGVDRRDHSDGTSGLSVRGLEFARATPEGLFYGIESRRRAEARNLEEIEALARELARVRAPRAADRRHPLFRSRAEAWLETQVRRHIELIEPSLLRQPIYGQVPAVAGIERGVLDLLAAGRDGRLAVLELKASEDIHLPLQALDYWMRVKWHMDRGEFSAHGYFPGIPLRAAPPRLLLVAPALEFHPKTETILRYFDPAIEVERIGLNAEWRERPEVMFRLRGAEAP